MPPTDTKAKRYQTLTCTNSNIDDMARKSFEQLDNHRSPTKPYPTATTARTTRPKANRYMRTGKENI